LWRPTSSRRLSSVPSASNSPAACSPPVRSNTACDSRSFEGSEYYGEFAHKLRYARIVTREPVPNTLRDRVTKLIASGVLEENIGLRLDQDRSRIMLCGNPEMVEDSRRILIERGFRMSRRGDPGHLAVENYW